MSRAFSNGSARTLIVEESGAGRQLVSDVVRGIGFHDIVVAGSGRDVLNLLEVEKFDWLVMPAMKQQEVNALHLLKLISEQPSLSHLRTSMIYEPGDDAILETAFSLGLMSCHVKTYMREEMQRDLLHMIEVMKATEWRPVLTALEYVRPMLMKQKRFDVLAAMERKLLQLYPGSASLLLKLGETLIRSGDIQGGVNTLRQAAIIDEKAIEVGRALMQKILNTKVLNSTGDAQFNALGTDVCVLIDPDSAVLGAVSSLLQKVGVPRVETFDDGEAAWKWLQANPEPGLILQEWRLPSVAGPLLLQRIRQHGHINVPIVVMSSVIKPHELPLLKELGVDNVVPKPFSQQLFFRTVVWSLQQSQVPTEQRSLERKMRKLLEKNQIGEAERLRRSYTLDRRIPTPAKKQVDAEFALFGGQYREARDLAIESLKLSGDSLLLLNLIGKALLKLGDHVAALKFFEKANSISPMNVEHLCNMAVSHFEGGAHQDAEFILQQAKALEPKSERIGDIEVQHAIIRGNVDQAKSLMEQLQSVGRIVGYMNNRAVALTRTGRYEEGIRLYRQTMASLPGEWSDTHDIVAYNLGLAFARYGDLQDAIEALKPTVERLASPLCSKAKALSGRIAHAHEKGLPLPLNSSLEDQDGSAEDPSGEARAAKIGTDAALQIALGDVCLSGIFLGVVDAQSWKLLEDLPRFQSRSAIERTEYSRVASGARR